ncbi:hypothetical protein TWF718_003528 [Orbilia javanica]|uniref:Uncharacterized protein n=1 Tax=Orbilia javanica TaxID=47235 RepID=A0AAN8MPD5_9PEZI
MRGERDWLWMDVKSRRAIGIIDQATLEPDDSLVSSASKSVLLCSYDWQDEQTPTILIPGHAPFWKDRELPVTIPEDSGSRFVDQNEARLSESPLEPIFHATASMNPNFRFDDVDVVVNRNTLQKLLTFCKKTSQESFRINLLMINNTLLIERRSITPVGTIKRNGGYGKSFEKEFTKPVQNSTGHHRVLQYHLGRLNCVVRFEVDASYQKNTEEQTENKSCRGSSLATGVEALNPNITKSCNMVSSSQGIATDTRLKSNYTAEEAMPQSKVAEIKTSSGRHGLNRIIPQLWFGRTPWLITASHNKGTFDEIDVSHISPEQFIDWEMKFQDPLRKVVTVIAQLRDIVSKHRGRHCIAVCKKDRRSGSRAIKVYASRSPDRQPLPEGLIKRFWDS